MTPPNLPVTPLPSRAQGPGCHGVTAAVADARGSCPSDGHESAAVCSTGKEQFSQSEPEIMIYINRLSNELAKRDAPAWCSRYAAFPVFLLLLDQHRLGVQDFKPEGIMVFYVTTDAIPKPHHSFT